MNLNKSYVLFLFLIPIPIPIPIPNANNILQNGQLKLDAQQVWRYGPSPIQNIHDTR